MIYNSFYGVVHQPIWMRLFLRSCLPTDLCGFLCRYIYADSQVCRTKINFSPIRIIILIQSRMEWKKMKRANFDQKFPIQIQLKLKFLFYECNEFSNIWWWICFRDVHLTFMSILNCIWPNTSRRNLKYSKKFHGIIGQNVHIWNLGF